MSNLFLIFILLGGTAFGQALAGNEKFQAKQYAEAITAYENTPQAERNAGLLNRLGISYHMQSRLKEAENSYRQALRLDSRFADPNNNLAILYYAQLKFGNAESQIRKALQLSPEIALMRFNLRAVRYARDNNKAARQRAGELSQMNPVLVEKVEGDLLQAVLLMPAKELEAATQSERRGDTFF